MRRRVALRVLALAVPVLLVAGCGGGSKRAATLDLETTSAPATTAETSEAAPPTTAVESTEEVESVASDESDTGDTAAVDPDTVTIDPVPPSTGADVAKAPFPATSAQGVIALAIQRPLGKVDYDVSFDGGSYTLTVAQDAKRGLLHQSQDTGDVWVGIDTSAAKVTFVCTATPGATPDCRKGDPDGVGASTAADLSKIIGIDFIRRTFGPVAAQPGVGLGQDQQVDRTVSCMATTVGGQDLRLCATQEGFVTQETAGTTKILATAIADTATDADLTPPSEPH